IPDMELREEWQDEEFPRKQHLFEVEKQKKNLKIKHLLILKFEWLCVCTVYVFVMPDLSFSFFPLVPPTSLALTGNTVRKKRLVAPTLSLTLDKTSTDRSMKSDDDTVVIADDLPRMGKAAIRKASLLEHAEMGHLDLDQVDSNGRRWRRFHIGGQDYQVNMSVLEPYLQVLSHGGYYGDGSTAIIMFTSCYLPENTTEHYEYVMDNLFRYIIGTLDLMVSENYILVYLCGMAPRNKMPGIKWLRQCYMSIDRRLRKDLKGLFVVHPAWYVRALITVIKPFISEKFSRKMRFIHSLQELAEFVPVAQLQIPDCIRQIMSLSICKKQKKIVQFADDF
uniref:BCL2/adenovirus E1B 19 kDa protein-interacting protein 2-like n=1 Tax=Sinocyclocheilus rhinocerous TaxID=307959 RepID=A0A673ICV7_9TELE